MAHCNTSFLYAFLMSASSASWGMPKVFQGSRLAVHNVLVLGSICAQHELLLSPCSNSRLVKAESASCARSLNVCYRDTSGVSPRFWDIAV